MTFDSFKSKYGINLTDEIFSSVNMTGNRFFSPIKATFMSCRARWETKYMGTIDDDVTGSGKAPFDAGHDRFRADSVG